MPVEFSFNTKSEQAGRSQDKISAKIGGKFEIIDSKFLEVGHWVVEAAQGR